LLAMIGNPNDGEAMRRLAGLLTALFCVVGTALIGAGAASAGPYSKDCAEIFASTTSPQPGAHIEVSGAHYEANESVAIYIGGTVTAKVVNSICTLTLSGGIRVGTGHTDGNGAFDPQVTVPDSLSGDQPLTGIGASGDVFDRASLVLNIGGNDNDNNGGNNGGTSVTGVEVMALLVTAALLLVGGIALARAGKRRSATPGAE
jgi:hypothetical protein